MAKQTELKKFLVLRPQPAQVRTKDPERLIEVPQRKGMWQELERTIVALDPQCIEALDQTGKVLRAFDMADADDDEKEDKADKDADPMSSNKHMAAVLDAHGKRMIEAFEAGVKASSSQQDHLVGLVRELTVHLSHALTNLHKLSAQVATLQTAGDASDSVAGQLIGAALGGQLGMGNGMGNNMGGNGANGKG